MDHLNLASGDNNPRQTMKSSREMSPRNLSDEAKVSTDASPNQENEIKLKERISQCKSIIDSLKLELNKEKSRFEKESNANKSLSPETLPVTSSDSDFYIDEMAVAQSMYSDTVDNKLNCGDNILEYEQQLQRYQNTLNMAQLEKKNAIRKQMLAKAYKLKLLEVENQCNIELLRVKQSLQCLEPLKMIVNKWKTDGDQSSIDLNTFELMPRYPGVNDMLTISSGDSSARKDKDMTVECCDKIKDDDDDDMFV